MPSTKTLVNTITESKPIDNSDSYRNKHSRNNCVMEKVVCDICQTGITHPICFQFNPCSHKACVKCFHQLVPVKLFLRCPCSGCRKWVTSSTLLEIRNGNDKSTSNECQSSFLKEQLQSENCDTIASATTRLSSITVCRNETTSHTTQNRSEAKLKEVQQVPHFQPDEQMDPFRHWAMKKPKLCTGFMYVAYRASNEEATFYKSNFTAVDSSVYMDDNSSNEMVKIFARILHPLLFRRSFSSIIKQQESMKIKQGPDEWHQDRQHLALRCVYALSSGLALSRKEQEENLESRNENALNQHNDENNSSQATKKLAQELMMAYKKACSMRTSNKKVLVERIPCPEMAPFSPSTKVHDLRPRTAHSTTRDRKREILERSLDKLNEYRQQQKVTKVNVIRDDSDDDEYTDDCNNSLEEELSAISILAEAVANTIIDHP